MLTTPPTSFPPTPLPLRTQVAPSKPAVRAVCVVLDAFHFPLPKDLVAPDRTGGAPASNPAPKPAPAVASAPVVAAPTAPAAPATPVTPMAVEAAGADAGVTAEGEQGEAVEVDEEMEVEEEDAGASTAVVAEVDREAQAAAVQRALLKRVLPALHRMLVKKGEFPIAR